jgi:hypothetical protein
MPLRVTPEGPIEISAALAALIRCSCAILSNIGTERRSARGLCQKHNLEEFAKVYAAQRHFDFLGNIRT